MHSELFGGGYAVTLAAQSAVILAAGLVVSYLARRHPARAHAALTAAVVACLVVPVLWIAVRVGGGGVLPAQASAAAIADVPNASVPGADDEAPGLVGSAPRSRAATDAVPSVPVAGPRSADAGRNVRGSWVAVERGAVLAWIGVSVLLLTRLVSRLVAAHRATKTAAVVDDEVLAAAVARAGERIGLSVRPKIRQVAEAGCPAIWCWSGPTVIVPSPVAKGADWVGIMCHELAHAKRRDHVWALMADLLVCAVPFQPLAWWARERMAGLSERACDEWALAGVQEGGAADYAETLLSFRAVTAPRLALGAVGRQSALAGRVRAILHRPRVEPSAGRRWAGIVVAAACIGAVGVAVAQPASKAAPKAKPEEAKELVAQPGAGTPSATVWKAKLAALDGKDWRESFSAGAQLAELAPDEGYAILSKNWATLPVEVRRQILKAWVFAMPYPLHQRMHPRLLDVLHLAATDPSTEVQKWAFESLKLVAFRDFAEDFQAYVQWHEQNANKPVEAVMVAAAGGWAAAVKGKDGAARSGALSVAGQVGNTMRDVPAVREAMREAMGKADMTGVIAEWLTPGSGRRAQDAASAVLPYLELPEDFLRRVVLPAAINPTDDAIRRPALEALGKHKDWAYEPLLALLRVRFESGASAEGALPLSDLAQSIAEFNDPSAIPLMIGIIKAESTYETVYGVGYFGLSKLTGVKYSDSHDGAWWADWWEKNKARFPEAVQKMEIPELKAPAKKVGAPAGGGADPLADVADVPSEKVVIGGDEKKSYFLIGPVAGAAAPAGGYHLLVVLPGGDGANFNPFVRRVLKNAMPKDYLIAELVAPVWREDKDRVVWPTGKGMDEKAAFSTEEFIRLAIADVGTRRKIDPKKVYAMAWSSSGPAVYASVVSPEVPLAGAFVAMSVYHPEAMPKLEGAKGRAVYILHSPDDAELIKMEFPQAAAKELADAGAVTKMTTYEGGHGWHGDVFGMIREGVEWMEKQARP